MTGTEAYRRPPPVKGAAAVSNARLRKQENPTALEGSDGFRAKVARGALITTSLPSLQNLVKRSPDAYSEEVSVQWNRFSSLVKIVQLGLGGAKGDEDKLKEVTGFVCQASRLQLCQKKKKKDGSRVAA